MQDSERGSRRQLGLERASAEDSNVSAKRRSRQRASSWRSLARQGKLAVPSSAEAVVVAPTAPEPQPAFATLEVDSATGPRFDGLSIEAHGVTVRLEGDIGVLRIAEIASALRGLR